MKMIRNCMVRKPARENEQGSRANPGEHGLILCQIGEHLEYPKAPFPMCFTRKAFCTLMDTVGIRPPESGAMGFSLADFMGFDLVEFSASGSANSGGAVYRPDPAWGAERQAFHLDKPVEALRSWSGDLHSHPFGCTHPSGKSGPGLGDLGYVEEVFAMNEWMEWFFIPIITGAGRDELTIHPWVCRRGKPLDLMIADLRICDASEFPRRVFNPVWEKRIAKEAEERKRREQEEMESQRKASEEEEQAGMEIQPPPFPEEYAEDRPIQPPPLPDEVIAVHGRNQAKQVVPSSEKVSERAGSVAESRAGHETVPAGQYFFKGEICKQDPAQKAPSLAAVNFMTRFGERDENGQYREEYCKRLKGIVSHEFRKKTILVVGVGAGSYAAEKLLRLCPNELRICDFDIVEFPNLARTSYTVPDALARRTKVASFALRAEKVNPWVRVRPYATNLTRMNSFQLDEMFDGVDLVIGGTDSLAAQAMVNTESVRRRIPAVFIGIHAGAQGGRVIWSIPGQTPCYRCVARDRFESVGQGVAKAADLVAATGSIFDCQFIDMVATKVAVAILERGRDSAMGRFFERMGQRNDIVIRCDPGYPWGNALWDAVLGDLPRRPKDFARELKEEAFLAMDSIWLKTAHDPDCPVCHGGEK